MATKVLVALSALNLILLVAIGYLISVENNRIDSCNIDVFKISEELSTFRFDISDIPDKVDRSLYNYTVKAAAERQEAARNEMSRDVVRYLLDGISPAEAASRALAEHSQAH